LLLAFEAKKASELTAFAVIFYGNNKFVLLVFPEKTLFSTMYLY